MTVLRGKDALLHYSLLEGQARAVLIDSTRLCAAARRTHHLSDTATIALGRLLTGAAIMGDMLKEENGSITVRMNGGGQGGSLIAVSDFKGNPRGYAQVPGLLIMPDDNGQLDITGAVGSSGTFSVVKDFGAGEPYIGQIPIVKGNVSEDITAYYAVSEQIPTVVLLGVIFDKIWNFSRAGGLFIQLLPAADEREIEIIEKNLKEQPKIEAMLENGLSMEEICQKVMTGFNLELLSEDEVSYKCNCSLERVKCSLMTLDKGEIIKMANEEESIEVCCHFCDKKYNLSSQELLDLIK